MLQTYPQYFQNAFDAEKAGRVEEIFERHIQVVPSLRDSKGRRLMIYQVTTGFVALFNIFVKSKVSIYFQEVCGGNKQLYGSPKLNFNLF